MLQTDFSSVTTEKVKVHLAASICELEKRLEQPLYNIFPDTGPYALGLYPKHLEAIKATETHDVVYFKAANRIGKTVTLVLCAVRWMTGIYPDSWEGRRFDHPTMGWLVGVDHQQLRDGVQRILLESAMVSRDGGMLPPELIWKTTSKSKPTGALLDIYVIHVPSYQKLTEEERKDEKKVERCCSIVTFKACQQSIDNFGGVKLDWAGIDEEPPMAHFSEIKLRTASGRIGGRPGVLFIAATPLKCRTPFVQLFKDNANDPMTGLVLKQIVASWDDVPHMTPEERARLLIGVPPHEIEARTMGIEYLGGGMTFPVAPHRYTDKEVPMGVQEFPEYYIHINGVDHGGVTALVFIAKNPITNHVYVWTELEFKDITIPVIASELKKISNFVYSSDNSINGVNPMDQQEMNQSFVNEGLIFKYPNKKLKNTMVGKIFTMMMAGQLHISDRCNKLLDAIAGSYRGEDGAIVKQNNDHHLDAFLYAMQYIDTWGMTRYENQKMVRDMHNAEIESLYIDHSYTPHNSNDNGSNQGWV